MRRGKKKCETLKAIRREVAKANGIDYEPTKCDYEGECKGTCPKCDAELAELQRQLDAKEQKGESVKYESPTTRTQLYDDEELYDEDPLTENTETLITDVDGWADIHYDEFRILLDEILELIRKRSEFEFKKKYLKDIAPAHEQEALNIKCEFESFCSQSETRVERKLLSLRRSWEKRVGRLEPTGTTEELDFLEKTLISLRDVKEPLIYEETTRRRYSKAEQDFLRNMMDFLEKRWESPSRQSEIPELIRLRAEMYLIGVLECGGLTGLFPFERGLKDCIHVFFEAEKGGAENAMDDYPNEEGTSNKKEFLGRPLPDKPLKKIIPEQKMGPRTSCIGTIIGISVIAWILLHLFAK